jgi:simple sugar transport system permease protein
MDIVRVVKKERHTFRLLGIFVLICGVFLLLKPGTFFRPSNVEAMSFEFPEYGIMALGVMLAMISGGIDLSFVAVANFTAIIAVLIMQRSAGLPVSQTVAVILLAMLVSTIGGCIIGLLNGMLVAHIGIPAFLVTLGSMQVFTGLSIVLTKGRAIGRMPGIYSETGHSKVFGVLPAPLLMFIVCFIFVAFLLRFTSYGANLYLVGANVRAAKFSAVNYKGVLIKTHMLVGMLSSIAGLIMISSYNSAKPDYGSGYLLQAILIVILGGVSPMGGVGKIGGVLIAILIAQVTSSGLNMFATINVHYRAVLWGLLLLIMIVVDYYEEMKKQGYK